MSFAKANQELRRDLRVISSDFKWSAVELRPIAQRLGLAGKAADAQAVLKMCAALHAGDVQLMVMSDKIVGEKLCRRVGN